MNIILAWVLVTISAQGVVTFSPPLATLESCEFLQQNLPQYNPLRSKCIQVKVVK